MKNNHIISAIFISVILTWPFHLFSQDISSIFREAQRLEETRNDAEALKKYQEVIKLQPSHLYALCKVSELYSVTGSRLPDKQAKMQYYKAAKQHAEAALRINSNYSDANFVMAMAMGRMALILSGQDKIKAVNDIKKFAETAIRNDQSNYKAYHVLGKWHYEVSNLNAFEKLGVKYIFGGFPPSSFAESIRNYEKSRSINPAFALNYFEVAKAYHKNNEDAKAIEVLKKLQLLPLKGTDDSQVRKDASRMLNDLQD